MSSQPTSPPDPLAPDASTCTDPRKDRVRGILARIETSREAAQIDRDGTEKFEQALAERTSRPWVTFALIAVNVIVFAVMVASGVSPLLPNPKQVYEWGGCYGPAIRGGQWWRLITADYVHYGIVHLGCNMYALKQLGAPTERLFGRLGYLVIYALSGLGGALLAVLWNPMVVSAGASGAIFGVVGAQCVLMFVKKHVVPKSALTKISRGAIVLAANNLAFGAIVPEISNSAHIGGLVTGAIVAACLPLASSATGEPERARLWRLVVPCALLAAAAAMIPHRLDSHPRTQAWNHYRAAAEAYRDGDDENASREVELCIALAPELGDAYVLRGDLSWKQSDYNGALESYNRATAAGVKRADVYWRRGWIQQNRGELAAARNDYEASIELDPNVGNVHFALGWVLSQTATWDRALAEYARALELGGTGVEEAYVGRGIVHYARARFAEALRDFRDGAKESGMIGFRAALYAWAARLEIDGREAADAELAEWRKRPSKASAANLSRIIAAYLMREIDAAELRSRAADTAYVIGNGQKVGVCESEFFIALERKASGDASGYRAGLAECLRTNAVDSAAYPCAKAASSR